MTRHNCAGEVLQGVLPQPAPGSASAPTGRSIKSLVTPKSFVRGAGGSGSGSKRDVVTEWSSTRSALKITQPQRGSSGSGSRRSVVAPEPVQPPIPDREGPGETACGPLPPGHVVPGCSDATPTVVSATPGPVAVSTGPTTEGGVPVEKDRRRKSTIILHNGPILEFAGPPEVGPQVVAMVRRRCDLGRVACPGSVRCALSCPQLCTATVGLRLALKRAGVCVTFRVPCCRASASGGAVVSGARWSLCPPSESVRCCPGALWISRHNSESPTTSRRQRLVQAPS